MDLYSNEKLSLHKLGEYMRRVDSREHGLDLLGRIIVVEVFGRVAQCVHEPIQMLVVMHLQSFDCRSHLV